MQVVSPVKRAEQAWRNRTGELERELIANGYDLKHLARQILNSRVYQRQCVDPSTVDAAQASLFAGPLRRRMSAEQIVDSLLTVSGKPFNVEDMNIDVDGLLAFTHIAELGTFHQAAKALFISQSALSRRIAKLESNLGVRLLDRTTRKVELTATGRDFLPQARHLVLDAQRTANDAELAVVRNRQTRLSASVDLMKSLGGGGRIVLTGVNDR